MPFRHTKQRCAELQISFSIVTVLYVAQLTERTPALQKVNFDLSTDDVFDSVSEIERVKLSDFCPCFDFNESRALAYDERVEHFNESIRASRTIVLYGYFQSWKYTQSITQHLRRYFKFHDDIAKFAEAFLKSCKPPRWSEGFVRVAVHNRRADILVAYFINLGYTTPDPNYFQRAMRYFVERYGRVQFIVASDDLIWARANIRTPAGLPSDVVSVTYVPDGQSPGQDMAILARCDHTIMSTGTYGWWAAWLAGGVTVYYKDWPRTGSELYGVFRSEDFFPPEWIPM